MNQDASLTAHFKPQPPPPDTFNLRLVAVPTNGGAAITSGRYEENTNVTIRGLSNPGFRFIN